MTNEREPEPVQPVRHDTKNSGMIFTRRTILASLAVLLGGSSCVIMSTFSESEAERNERHDRELEREIDDVFDEMMRTGTLPPGVHPQQMTAEARRIAVKSTYITMQGIWGEIEREPIIEEGIRRSVQNYRRRQEMKSAHREWVREHLKESILVAVDQN